MALWRRRSDSDLLLAVPGDPEAFGEFYRRHERDLLRYFVHWTKSPELAADLTAESFATALESIAAFAPERGEPRAWLFGIARNVLARSVRRGRVDNEVRRRLGLAAVVVDEAAAARIEALLDEDGPAAAALEDLPALLRDAVEGRVLHEREYREIAEALECSEDVVRQRVRRGLVRLRARLEEVE